MIGFGASGFGGTPVSKALGLATIILSLVFGISRDRHAFTLSTGNIRQIWRLLTSHLIFSSMPELLFGILILYSFRTFERMFGSRKFATIVLFLMTSSCVLQLILSYIYGGLYQASSGPYSVIFGLFVYFFALIPSISGIKIAGISIGEKLIMYLLGAQLAFTNVPDSAIASLLGLVSGLLHYPQCLPFNKIRVPQRIASLFDTVFSPILMSNELNNGTYRNYRSFGNGTSSASDDIRDPLTAPPPNENDVTILVGMGFSEDAVRRALAESYNDVQRATNILLDGSR